MYESKDLYNWKDLGVIIPPDLDDPTSPLHPNSQMDRPHIIYCEKTGKYVAWLKIMASGESQFFTIMTADRFEGPYEMVHKVHKPLKMDSGDFALHVDEQTKKAYIWFERPHFQMICATLTDDYTQVSDEYSVHFDGTKPPECREAPTYFERNGKKYLLTSGTSWYYPNPTMAHCFTEYHGEYTDLGDPCEGDRKKTSFFSQFTSVIHIPDSDLYIACGDQWCPQLKYKLFPQYYISTIAKAFTNYVPDTSPKEVHPPAGKLGYHPFNTSIARYVWLPIQWKDDKPVIRWYSSWRWEDFL